MSDYTHQLRNDYQDARMNGNLKTFDFQQWAARLYRGDQSDQDIMRLVAERDNNAAEVARMQGELLRCSAAQVREANLAMDGEAEIKRLRAEAERWKHEFDQAASLVAEMHAAAVGEISGPTRGVVEDVTEVRNQMLIAQADLRRAREFHPRAMKLIEKGKNFLVIAEDELYYGAAYESIRWNEMHAGRWSEGDERIYNEAMERWKVLFGWKRQSPATPPEGAQE